MDVRAEGPGWETVLGPGRVGAGILTDSKRRPGVGRDPAVRRACGQPSCPPAAGRGPVGLGLRLLQRWFSPPIGCGRRDGAGLRCPEKM